MLEEWNDISTTDIFPSPFPASAFYRMSKLLSEINEDRIRENCRRRERDRFRCGRFSGERFVYEIGVSDDGKMGLFDFRKRMIRSKRCLFMV